MLCVFSTTCVVFSTLFLLLFLSYPHLNSLLDHDLPRGHRSGSPLSALPALSSLRLCPKDSSANACLRMFLKMLFRNSIGKRLNLSLWTVHGNYTFQTKLRTFILTRYENISGTIECMFWNEKDLALNSALNLPLSLQL